jgi:hypothetical protein
MLVIFQPNLCHRFNKPYFQPNFPNKNNLSSNKVKQHLTLLPYPILPQKNNNTKMCARDRTIS